VTFNLDEIIERAVYISPGVHRIVPTEDFAAMVERIEDLELHLASAIKERDEYRSRIDAMFWCEACDRLEIERATPENAGREERAAVVAFLREGDTVCMQCGDRATLDLAYRIECGEHRKEKA
jgi:predicted DNA-binding protein (UPF0251 family)